MLGSAILFCIGMGGCQMNLTDLSEEAVSAQTQQAPPGRTAEESNGVVIMDESPLPDAYPRTAYLYTFHVRGNYVTPLHWRIEKGELPPGIKLEDHGTLHGEPERAGEFQFTVSVTDSGKPQQAVQKQFVLRVVAGLELAWKAPAHVSGSRIEGSTQVTNTTPDDIDLTFIVLAVATENSRATAIGYQHFLLKRGTIGMELSFGENLPRGSYKVHVDAVGEVAKKNAIYRDRMESSALYVAVGP